MTKEKKDSVPYIHGYDPTEQERLRYLARFAEFTLHQDVNLSGMKNVLEVGCGVGAQSEILLRRYPDVQLQGIDLSSEQLGAARGLLDKYPHYKGRYNLNQMDACNLDFESNSFDGAFLCWILEHVPDPLRVLSEVRRVVRPGGRIYVTEVMNSSFFLEPYSPSTWKYWMAFNDYQYDHGGDPFIGAKLGNLLMAVGLSQIKTNIKSWHLDNRNPDKRKDIIEFWKDLLVSGSEQLIEKNYTNKEEVQQMVKELRAVQKDPNAVFLFSYMQAKAIVGV